MKRAAYPLSIEVQTPTGEKKSVQIGRLSAAALLELADTAAAKRREHQRKYDAKKKAKRVRPADTTVREFVVCGLSKGAPEDAATGSELFGGYVRFCRARAWQPLTQVQAERLFPMAIRDVHGICRRNDVMRGGTPRRGYSVRIEPIAPSAADSSP